MKKFIIVLITIAVAFATVSCSKEETRIETIEGNFIDGHEAVDMGDGLLWATCNIGAESETDYGAYFSWGETSEKSSYFANKYTFGKVDPQTPDDFGMQKYNTQDNRTRLLSEDDAATTLWGESWRTPTSAEFQKLMNPELYEVRWTSKEGKDGKEIYGLEITSTKNKNSIFLPAAGHIKYIKPESQGEMLAYWSSSLSRDDSGSDALTFDRTEVCFADFLTFSDDKFCVFQQLRYVGLSIRAVASPVH